MKIPDRFLLLPVPGSALSEHPPAALHAATANLFHWSIEQDTNVTHFDTTRQTKPDGF